MSTIIREFEDISSKCSAFLQGVLNKDTKVLKELDAFMSDVFDYVKKTDSLPPQISSQIHNFYSFLKSIIPEMLRSCSPGAVAVFSIYIIQFVGYCLEHDIIEYVNLLELFFTDETFLTKFKNLTPQESAQYNTIIAGDTEGYIAHPAECLFGRKLPSGVDFIALTLQNFGRRAYFSIAFQKILRCKSFNDVAPIINFLNKSTTSMDENFKKFVAQWFITNLTNHEDPRYKGFESVSLSRFIFFLPDADQQDMLDRAAFVYYLQINAAAGAGKTPLVIGELEAITKQENHSKILDEFISQLLKIILQADVSKAKKNIIQTVKYLKDSEFLDKELVYSKVSSCVPIIKEIFPIISSVVVIPDLYQQLREDFKENSAFLMTILPYCDPKEIKTIGSDLLKILFVIQQNDIPEFIKICTLPQFVKPFVESVNAEIKNPKIKAEELDLICSAADVINEGIDKHNLFITLLNTLIGDQLVDIFEKHSGVPIEDLPAFVRSANTSTKLPQFLREKFFNKVLSIAPYLPMTSDAGELVFDAFLAANSFNSRERLPDKIIHREAIWIVLFTAVSCDNPPLRNELIAFVNMCIESNPKAVINDLASILQGHITPLIANSLMLLDLSPIDPNIVAEKLDETPNFIFVLHVLKQKAEVGTMEKIIQKISKEGDVTKLAFYFDAALSASDEDFRLLKPLTEKISQVFSVQNDNIGYLYATRSISLKCIKRLNIKIPMQNYEVIFEFAVMNGFEDLARFALSVLKNTKEGVDQKMIDAALSHASKTCSKMVIELLESQKTMNAEYSMIKSSTSETLAHVINLISQWDNNLIAESYGRFKMAVLNGSASVELVETAIEKIPLLPGIESEFATFFFSPEFPPQLRTQKAVVSLFKRYQTNCSGLLKFIDTISQESVSLCKTGLEAYNNCPSLNSVVQVISSYDYALFSSASQDPKSKFTMDLAKLVYSSLPFFKSQFASDPTFAATLSTDAVLRRVLDLLPNGVKDIFSFNVVEAKDSAKVFKEDMTEISVNLMDAYKTFLNTFFRPKGHKDLKINRAPPMLCIRLIPPETNAELKPMSLPPKIDFKEFVANPYNTIYQLHGIVSFSKKDRKKYSAFIRTEDSHYFQCEDIYCSKVTEIPDSQIPELLFYKKVNIKISKERLFNKLSPAIKAAVNSPSHSATRAFEIKGINFDSFKKNKQFHFLVSMLLRKFKIYEPLRNNYKDPDFSKTFFDSSLDIICNKKIFKDNREFLCHMASIYPVPEELRKNIEQGIHAPNIGGNVLGILLSLKLSPDSVWSVIQGLREMKEAAINDPMFPNFVEPLFAKGVRHERAKYLLNDPNFSKPIVNKKLPNYVAFVERRQQKTNKE